MLNIKHLNCKNAKMQRYKRQLFAKIQRNNRRFFAKIQRFQYSCVAAPQSGHEK